VSGSDGEASLCRFDAKLSYLLALIVGRMRGNVNPQAGIGVRIRVPEVLDLRHHFSAVGARLLCLDFPTAVIRLHEPISGLHVSSSYFAIRSFLIEGQNPWVQK
jgi:hypothetical protein